MDFAAQKTMLSMNLDDKNHEYYLEEPDLRILLNASYQHIYNQLMQRDIFTKKTSQTVSMISGIQEVALASPNTIHKIIYVEDTDNIPIPIYKKEYARRSNVRSVYVAEYATPGSPSNRVLKLGWYQKPTSNFDLTVDVAEKIGQYAVGAVSTYTIDDIPPEYHNVIILYATILGVGKDEDNIQTWVTLFQAEFDAMINGLGTRSEEASEVVDYNYATD